MQLQIMIFGQLKDITGKSELTLYDIPDTDTLIETLQSLYPDLKNFKFAIALNKKVISTNTILEGDNNIALLPPFSGG